MEFVGLMLILTFVAMLTTCGLAFPMQSPPPERHALRCPEDDAAASVIVSWDRTQQQVRIIGCDHQRMAEHGCLERCLPQLQVAFPARVPTTGEDFYRLSCELPCIAMERLTDYVIYVEKQAS